MTKIEEFKYESQQTPKGYICEDCGAENVRLYREYQSFKDHLRCRKCALKNQNKETPSGIHEHSIGWLVAAVPTEDGETFWGFTSVPENGVEWWNNLPK